MHYFLSNLCLISGPTKIPWKTQFSLIFPSIQREMRFLKHSSLILQPFIAGSGLLAASDILDHDILIIWCYLSHSKFYIYSSITSTDCGVPRGVLLDPVSILMIHAPTGKHYLSFHCYADDAQVDLLLKPNHLYSLQSLKASH